MRFIISHFSPCAPALPARAFDTFDDAIAYARKTMGATCLEIDETVTYPAADFFARNGEVYAIQPANHA